MAGRPGWNRSAPAAARDHHRPRHLPRTHHARAPPQRLPGTLDQALATLRRSQVIPAAMGADLYEAFTAVRAAEAETFQGQDPEAIAAAHRWRY